MRLHEAEERNEYFVPVPVKCIGDPNAFERRFGNRFTPAGRAAFHALRLEYERYFAGNDWRAYWSPRQAAVPSLGDVGVFTRADGPRPYAGLYELVAADAAQSGTRAMLVGYSQGGLVARVAARQPPQCPNVAF